MGSGQWVRNAMEFCPADYRRQALARANAIVALAGYVPTEFDRKLDEGLISGKLTSDQAITLIKERALELRKKKTTSKQNT